MKAWIGRLALAIGLALTGYYTFHVMRAWALIDSGVPRECIELLSGPAPSAACAQYRDR